MSSLSHTLTEHDEAISAALATFFQGSIQNAHSIHPRYELLWRELARVTQNGGKRLRPKITILAYEAFGGTTPADIIPVAAAQEILHSSLLIHDDIIDRETTRRGELNVAGAYERIHYKDIAPDENRRHYSDSASLLAGDLLLAATFQLMSDCPLPLPRLRAAQDVFYRIIFEVAAGQLLDTELSFLDDVGVSAEQIARYKTASYSFIGPLLIGATLAGADEASLKLLENFALNLGIAYQLNDDLIGTFGEEAESGKSTSGDLREGKKTFLIEQFLILAPPDDKMKFQSLFGRPDLTDPDARFLKLLIERSGAKTQTEAMIDAYIARAREVVSQLDINAPSRDSFERLIEASTRRHA